MEINQTHLQKAATLNITKPKSLFIKQNYIVQEWAVSSQIRVAEIILVVKIAIYFCLQLWRKEAFWNRKKFKNSSWNFPPELSLVGWAGVSPLWFGSKAQQKISEEYIWVQTQVPGFAAPHTLLQLYYNLH